MIFSSLLTLLGTFITEKISSSSSSDFLLYLVSSFFILFIGAPQLLYTVYRHMTKCKKETQQ